MTRRAALAACAGLVLLLALPAAAQLRTLPAEAKHGRIRHVQELIVEVDGLRARLAPGAQVRDSANRIVLPSAIPAGALAGFVLDAEGAIRAVWLLTPEEAASRGLR